MNTPVNLQVIPSPGEQRHFEGNVTTVVKVTSFPKGCLSFIPGTSSTLKREMHVRVEGRQQISVVKDNRVLEQKIMYDHYSESFSLKGQEQTKGSSLRDSLIKYSNGNYEVLQGDISDEDFDVLERKAEEKEDHPPHGYYEDLMKPRTVEEGDTFRASLLEERFLEELKEAILDTVDRHDTDFTLESNSRSDGKLHFSVQWIQNEDIGLMLSGKPVFSISFSADDDHINTETEVDLEMEIVIDRNRMKIRSIEGRELRTGILERADSRNRTRREKQLRWYFQ